MASSRVLPWLLTFTRSFGRQATYRLACVHVPDVHAPTPGAILLLPDHDVHSASPAGSRERCVARPISYAPSPAVQIERGQLHFPHSRLRCHRGCGPATRRCCPALHRLGPRRQDAGIPRVERRAAPAASPRLNMSSKRRCVSSIPRRSAVTSCTSVASASRPASSAIAVPGEARPRLARICASREQYGIVRGCEGMLHVDLLGKKAGETPGDVSMICSLGVLIIARFWRRTNGERVGARRRAATGHRTARSRPSRTSGKKPAPLCGIAVGDDGSDADRAHLDRPVIVGQTSEASLVGSPAWQAARPGGIRPPARETRPELSARNRAVFALKASASLRSRRPATGRNW